MTWNRYEHSNQDNLTWSWLRAVEWGRWPIFVSQPFVPVLFLLFDWKAVVVGIVVLNLLWAILVRYAFVSVRLAFLGALVVRLKWLTCPAVAIYLFLKGEALLASLSLFWPLLAIVVAMIVPTRIGRIQNMFMAKLGYEYIPAELRILKSELKSELASLTFNSDVSERLLKKARRRYPKKNEIEIYSYVIEEYKKTQGSR